MTPSKTILKPFGVSHSFTTGNSGLSLENSPTSKTWKNSSTISSRPKEQSSSNTPLHGHAAQSKYARVCTGRRGAGGGGGGGMGEYIVLPDHAARFAKQKSGVQYPTPLPNLGHSAGML